MFSLQFAEDGTIECSSPQQGVYVLTFSSGTQNQVTTPFLTAFAEALDRIDQQCKTGVLVITSSNPKFFSNGFDLNHVQSHPNIVEEAVHPLLKRLLSFPMPTIALINGHAFGAGVFIAMAADYRIQNPSKGYLCLPEVDMGLVIPPVIAMMLQQKMSSSLSYRTAVLEGKRFKGPDALQLGIIDALGGLEECMALIAERDLIAKSKGGVYGELKQDAHRSILTAIDASSGPKSRI